MLYYREIGQGSPLVLLHGLFGSLENLGGLARTCALNHTIYSVDLPDHGRSPHTEHSDLPTMVDRLLQWMDSQKLSRPIVVGHSLGGKVAMELALTHPDRVTSLVVLDAAPVAYDNRHSAVFAGLLSIPLENLQSRNDADAVLRKRVSDPAIRGFLLKNLVREGERFAWRMNLEGLHQGYGKLVAANREGSFDGPTLFVRGGMSDYIQGDAESEIGRRFPMASIETIEGAGHWLHVEQPEAVGQIISDFLGRNTRLHSPEQ